jgi:hypothetical protein
LLPPLPRESNPITNASRTKQSSGSEHVERFSEVPLAVADEYEICCSEVLRAVGEHRTDDVCSSANTEQGS